MRTACILPRPCAAARCEAEGVGEGQLAGGKWAERHVQALAADAKNAQVVMGLLECVRDAQAFVQAQPDRQRQAHMRCATRHRKHLRTHTSRRFTVQQRIRDFPKQIGVRVFHRNLVCVCNAACPEETAAWVKCFRRAVRKQREGADPSTFSNCDETRRRLDACTQYASTRLLHAAVIAQDSL